jgi:peptide/nickel transport system permease protein
MTAYLVRRLLQAVVVLFGVSLVVFVLVQLSGDPVLLMLSGTAATEQDLQELREELGYNDPAVVQYLRYLGNLLSGDMGNSLRFKRPALDLVLERLGATFLLAVSALIFALVVAIPVGILSAIKRNSWIDHFGMLLALLGQSLPLFWLGIMLVLIFSVRLSWFPASGIGSWQHLILPMITLGAYPMARIARLLRSSMLDVINEDYILTARAKGLKGHTVVIRHTLRNAALPVVTIVGLMFGTLMAGAVITETIFVWPGVGLLTIQAIQNRDFPLVQAAVLIVSITFVFVNLGVDLLYAYIDPRIKYG